MSKYMGIHYKDMGHTMKLSLSQFNGNAKYKPYVVFCRYRYSKKLKKYIVDMALYNKDMKIYIDVQSDLVRSERETIRPNICRIVSQAMSCGFFDRYIEQFDSIKIDDGFRYDLDDLEALSYSSRSEV